MVHMNIENQYQVNVEDGLRCNIMACEFCIDSNEKVLYQSTIHTKLYIHKFGLQHTIETVCSGYCPPSVECGLQYIDHNSAFIINFCPNCGEDLRKGVI